MHEDRKAAGPSSVVAEMVKAPPNICCTIIAYLMNIIISEEKVPADCSDSIIMLFKGKGDALDWSNYRGLKLTDHVLKVFERVVENILDTVILMKCSLASALVEAQQMQFLFLDSFKRSISQNTGNCVWHLSIWKRPSIECLERYCDGLLVSSSSASHVCRCQK